MITSIGLSRQSGDGSSASSDNPDSSSSACDEQKDQASVVGLHAITRTRVGREIEVRDTPCTSASNLGE